MRINLSRHVALLMLCLLPLVSISQTPRVDDGKDSRMQWWRDARFGMFIHWGIYAIPAGEWKGQTDYGEWIRNNAQIPLDTYDTLRQYFNPIAFDAEAWVRMAKNAGMKYIVLTSKHHDGFCLFDSKETDFDVMNTPFKRDIVRELSDACQREGIVFGLYHSIMDWHHPDYLPRRVWEDDRSVDGAKYERYVTYMKAQVRELLTNYGPIGILWFDGEWESTWTEEYGTDMYAYVRSLQPDIVINNRVGAARTGMSGMTAAGGFGGDFGTPEQEVPATGMPGVDWESCMTMNENWGFNQADTNFKSTKELLQTLIDIASKGGNYLLNVGPTAEGKFPQESIERLRGIGDWMKVNGESIYGSSASPFKNLLWGRSTQRQTSEGTIVYLHVYDWPSDGRLVVPGLTSVPVSAHILGETDGQKLAAHRSGDGLVIEVPNRPLSEIATVIALLYEETPRIYHAPRIESDASIFLDSLSVRVGSEQDGVEIRYTLDGDIPSAASPVAEGAITLTRSSRLTVRSFVGDDPVSPTHSSDFSKVYPRQAVSGEDLTPGISYAYYEGEWDSLPEFGSLIPLKSGVMDSLVLSPRLSEERFGFVFHTWVEVPETGVYLFSLSSDDGSRLWLHDSLVVDNDGLHGMKEMVGTVALAKGYHPVRIEHFERTGSQGLRVTLGLVGQERRPLDHSSIRTTRSGSK